MRVAATVRVAVRKVLYIYNQLTDARSLASFGWREVWTGHCFTIFHVVILDMIFQPVFLTEALVTVLKDTLERIVVLFDDKFLACY